ncbi:signal transduction histidine kinase [Kribbella steppae]|uniref:histidine kinase n=1 Tax=Kribbella steppae TaxID=2512223 RepID=A0A4R2H3T2_9ACTN|nr:sensor histidine kinase [Kribbella steppae]TCO19804.1 signal transduction histidine kinase [Kribbella steppae]
MVSVDEYAERNPRLTDVFIVIALLGAAVLGANLIAPGESRPQDVWVAEAVTGLACLALLKAREHPRVTVMVTTACAVATGSLGFLLTPLLLAPVMVALYWLAATSSSRTTWAYGGIAVVLVVSTAVGVTIDGTVVLRAVGPALWLLLPLAMGSRSRLRHAYLDAVHARAEHAERTRDEEARLRVTEERMRIARDLHEVVAHHMAVANAQAGTAAHLFETDPELSKKILTELQATTSSVMLELRDTVGVLRQMGTDTENLEPAPGLDQLTDLLEVCRSAGLAVNLEIEGEPRDLSPGVDLTAYRIIQEALTNATKHSASAVASLRLRYSSTRLTITVTNDVRPDDESGPGDHGYGIIGMRERAHSIGGDLRVSDSRDVGFEVVTDLPVQPRVSAPHVPAPQVTS